MQERCDWQIANSEQADGRGRPPIKMTIINDLIYTILKLRDFMEHKSDVV